MIMISFEDIKKANEKIKLEPVQGKDYAQVNQRVVAFRRVYPTGFITTNMISDENGVCVFRAEAGYYDDEGKAILLGTGTAYEKEGSSRVNQTSYIENCETSSVGRALGNCGFGIETSFASKEEVENAILNQTDDDKKLNASQTKGERKASEKQLAILKDKYKGDNLNKLLKANNIKKIEDLPMKKASEIISKLKGGK